MAKQNKPVRLSVMYLMSSRDELVMSQIRASFANRGVHPSLIDQAIEEAFKNTRREYVRISQKSHNNLAEILHHKFTLIPRP